MIADLIARLFGRYPIRARATWAAIIAGAGTLALQLGVDAQLTESVQDVGTAVLNLLVLVGLVFTSEKVVTPLSDPRDDAGNQLTPGPIGTDGGTTSGGI